MHGDARISDKMFLIFLIWHNSTSFQVVDLKKRKHLKSFWVKNVFFAINKIAEKLWRLCWKMGCNLLFSALFFFGGGIRLSSDQWQSKQNQTAGKTLTNSSSIHSSSKKLSIAALIFRPSSLHFISKIIFFFWI